MRLHNVRHKRALMVLGVRHTIGKCDYNYHMWNIIAINLFKHYAYSGLSEELFVCFALDEKYEIT